MGANEAAPNDSGSPSTTASSMQAREAWRVAREVHSAAASRVAELAQRGGRPTALARAQRQLDSAQQDLAAASEAVTRGGAAAGPLSGQITTATRSALAPSPATGAMGQVAGTTLNRAKDPIPTLRQARAKERSARFDVATATDELANASHSRVDGAQRRLAKAEQALVAACKMVELVEAREQGSAPQTQNPALRSPVRFKDRDTRRIVERGQSATEAICASCEQIVGTDADHNLVSHLRAFSDYECYASGTPARLTVSPLGAGAMPRARLASSSPPVFVSPPEWLPAWDGEHLATIALPATGPVGVWLPAMTEWQQGNRVSDWSGARRRAEWDESRGCWTVAASLFLGLANQMLSRNSRVVVGREFDPYEACTTSCQNASQPYCRCSCRAEHHGRGRWMKGWTVLHEMETVFMAQSWHWRVVTLES